QPHAVVYLGRITAVMRERAGGEFRAGPVTPLIDQAATGISSSTFDVTTSEEPGDLRSMRSNFVALREQPVTAVPLPAFDRARAQRWWEDGTQPAETAAVAPAAPAPLPVAKAPPSAQVATETTPPPASLQPAVLTPATRSAEPVETSSPQIPTLAYPPPATVTLSAIAPLRTRPLSTTAAASTLAAGSAADVLSSTLNAEGYWLLVRAKSGEQGWLQARRAP
ncbi:MAG TPA: hypothetical protein VM369_01240, partial [Candidatus Binatia bacterium]|nr:hypothetical protein [Candidatus Binatia bacterium]